MKSKRCNERLDLLECKLIANCFFVASFLRPLTPNTISRYSKIFSTSARLLSTSSFRYDHERGLDVSIITIGFTWFVPPSGLHSSTSTEAPIFCFKWHFLTDWSKSTGRGRGGPEHLKKNHDPILRFGPKLNDPPLQEGWKLHDPVPSLIHYII